MQRLLLYTCVIVVAFTTWHGVAQDDADKKQQTFDEEWLREGNYFIGRGNQGAGVPLPKAPPMTTLSPEDFVNPRFGAATVAGTILEIKNEKGSGWSYLIVKIREIYGWEDMFISLGSSMLTTSEPPQRWHIAVDDNAPEGEVIIRVPISYVKDSIKAGETAFFDDLSPIENPWIRNGIEIAREKDVTEKEKLDAIKKDQESGLSVASTIDVRIPWAENSAPFLEVGGLRLYSDTVRRTLSNMQGDSEYTEKYSKIIQALSLGNSKEDIRKIKEIMEICPWANVLQGAQKLCIRGDPEGVLKMIELLDFETAHLAALRRAQDNPNQRLRLRTDSQFYPQPGSMIGLVVHVLKQFTGQFFSDSKEWRAWYDRNKDHLKWDAEKGQMVVNSNKKE